MAGEIVYYIITTAIGIALAVIGYFLKDAHKTSKDNAKEIQQVKLHTASDKELKELRDKVTALGDKYATKEEVREIKQQMAILGEDIKEIKDSTVKSGDFTRVMTRLEDKIDALIRGGVSR